jgi:hypothetical protein
VSNFDPIPRLQQIAATIEESGADIFDAPATAVHYIECAIKEIERLHRDYSCICGQMRRMMEERDEARRLYCIAFQEITENLGEKNTTGSIAKEMGWDCFKENHDD